MKKRSHLLKLLFLSLAAFVLVTAFGPREEAAAASYKEGTVTATSQAKANKIGSKYFWFKTVTNSETGKISSQKLYCSSSRTGKAYKLASVSGETSYNRSGYLTGKVTSISSTIWTNGSLVYYVTETETFTPGSATDTCTFKLCRIKTTGKNKKTVASEVLTELSGDDLTHVTLYNNTLYYWIGAEKEGIGAGDLYAITLKSGAEPRVVAGYFVLRDYSGKQGRYIYGRTAHSSSSGAVDYDIVIFDCKKEKVIRTLSAESDSTYNRTYGVNKGDLYLTGSRMYYVKTISAIGGSYLRSYVYRCKLDGSGTKTKVLTVKNGYINYVTSSKIYYEKYTSSGSTAYYVYNVKSKTKKKLSWDEYYEKLKALGYY